MTIDDVTGDRVNLIDLESAALMRAATIEAGRIPFAQMEPIGLEFLSLQPGERAVLPVKWSIPSSAKFSECSTHPAAPQGLVVLPGPCDAREQMSVVVENESSLPITISEEDLLVIGVGEDEIPSVETCAAVQNQRENFYSLIDWKGVGKDCVREIPSPVKEERIVVVIHNIPRFSSCSHEELPKEWSIERITRRITTLTYEGGEVDYVAEAGPSAEWTKIRPWCGQTVFTFAVAQSASMLVLKE